jgi:tRNA dimethylallyltransferase
LHAIEDVHRQGRIPLLVGGTGLYFRSLERGISELPASDPVIRERLEREAGVLGWQALHLRLSIIDPVAAERIHPNDPQRIQRALELYEITGKSRTDLIAASGQSGLEHPLIKLIIVPAERQVIHERISKRFQEMLDRGFVDEVRKLRERHDLHAGLPSMRMVGYRQVWRFLEGLISAPEMQEHAIVATRQLAKRQLTWLRSEQNGSWLDASDPMLLDNTLKILRKDPNMAVFV